VPKYKCPNAKSRRLAPVILSEVKNLPTSLPLKIRGTKGVISIIFITPLTPLTLRGACYGNPDMEAQMPKESRFLNAKGLRPPRVIPVSRSLEHSEVEAKNLGFNSPP